MKRLSTKAEFKEAFKSVKEYNVMPLNNLLDLVFIDEDSHREYAVSFEDVFKMIMEVGNGRREDS